MKPLSFLLLLLLAASCKRDDNTQPQPTPTPTPTPQPIVQPISTWVIGTDSFASNKTTLTYGKSIVVLACEAENSTFGYSNSASASLPYGSYRFNTTGTNNPAYLRLRFSLTSNGNKSYAPVDSVSYVVSDSANGIFTMRIPLSKFVEYHDRLDTQLIRGTIRVREK